MKFKHTGSSDPCNPSPYSAEEHAMTQGIGAWHDYLAWKKLPYNTWDSITIRRATGPNRRLRYFEVTIEWDPGSPVPAEDSPLDGA